MKNNLEFDRLVKKVAVLGTKGLVLVIVVNSAGVAGAVAIASSLLLLGPGGMVGGMTIMALLLLISNGIYVYGLQAILEAVAKELQSQGQSKQSIKNEISKYWISYGMKNQLYRAVDRG